MMNRSSIARRLVRGYLFGRARTGRSALKRTILPLLPKNQIVELEHGLSIHLDLSKTNHQFLFWFYEEHESSLQWAIKTLLPMGGSFVDCGANLGLMGLLAIHQRGARVLFIEPHPRLAEMIRQDLELNRFTAQADVCEAAAFHENGEAPLQVEARSDGGHSMKINPDKESGPSISVKTCRLETLFKERAVQHVDFLKIDVEGLEFQVLEGLGSFLDPHRIDVIYVEMGRDYEAAWRRLVERGYRAFAANSIYIDRLRQLERKKDISRFFRPTETPEDGNLLWCAPESPCEKFLLHACRFPVIGV